MKILSHSAIPVYTLPGLQHQSIARKSEGTDASEAWKQTLSPRAATPLHYHECEEVICILKGEWRDFDRWQERAVRCELHVDSFAAPGASD